MSEKIKAMIKEAFIDGCLTSGMTDSTAEYFYEMSEWSEKQINDGWIGVDKHHIEWSCVVAIPLASGELYINMVNVGDEGDLFDVDGSYVGYHASQVSHWMPLPKTPTTK